MKKLIAVALAACLLTACAGQQIEEGMRPMVGQHVSVVFSRLGYPDGEQRVAGRKVYVWANQSSSVVPITTPTTTYGSVGSTPVMMTTNSTRYHTMNSQCQIRVIVDDREVVRNFDWRGNESGCAPYGRRLSR